MSNQNHVDALRLIMRMADEAKEPCGSDPESHAAVRNGKFASIAQVAAQGLGLVRGPELAAALSSATPAVRESVAKAIYEQWVDKAGYVPWIEGGNSLKQDDARDIARAALDASPVPLRGSAEPDTVPWPVVAGYSGGGSPDGLRQRVWIRFGDGPEEVEYAPAPARDVSEPLPADAGAQEVPSAFKTVPTEPTQRMGKAGVMVGANSTFAADMIYRAMVAEAPLLASPPPQSAPQDAQPDLSQWEKPRFGTFLENGQFEEFTADDPCGEKHPRGHLSLWVGGVHDMQLLRAALSALQASQSAPVAGMTDAEIDRVADHLDATNPEWSWKDFARAIEAALREKAGGK